MTIASVQEAEQGLEDAYENIKNDIFTAIDLCDTVSEAVYMLVEDYDIDSFVARLLYDCIALVFNEHKGNSA